jgi:hypothetical protein
MDVDLVVLPPEPSDLTDEEEVDEDDVATNEKPRDIPGNLEVFIARDEDLWHNSDDEPLSFKSAKKKRFNYSQSSWRKCNPTYSVSPVTVSDDTVQQCREKIITKLCSKNPIDIFERIFDEEVLSIIITFSTLYAAQKNKDDFSISISELRSYFGILLLSGYHTLPTERLY